MNTPLLELYYFDSCPYCQRVLEVIDQQKIKVDYKNIYDDDQNLEKLIGSTGKKTVPCLFIDGAPMHESKDIMSWLRINTLLLEKTN